uniref:Uncharacterized protein n=1 Tax=Myoviridae sp. ctWiL39 TaxID=2825120 RepID=A0A8S5PWH7_9CAUD|nr:MAG TPA: hypothetical protein [Myoviridae sp. ctWiL39]
MGRMEKLDEILKSLAEADEKLERLLEQAAELAALQKEVELLKRQNDVLLADNAALSGALAAKRQKQDEQFENMMRYNGRPQG